MNETASEFSELLLLETLLVSRHHEELIDRVDYTRYLYR
jgi:hypothetical protein